MQARKILALVLCASMLVSALALGISLVRADPGVLPYVMNVSPAGANVNVGTNVDVTFSEAMDEASAEGAFSLTSGGTTVLGKTTWNPASMVMTFTPSGGLAHNTQYTVLISGAMDQDGEAMGSPYSSSFTTANAPDNIKPAISSPSPSSSATLEASGDSVTQTFSASLSDDVGVTTVEWRLDGRLVTTQTGTQLTSASYNFVLPVGSYTVNLIISDAAGNTAEHSWSVAVEAAKDTTPPAIANVVPGIGQMDVDVNTSIQVTFSEPMNHNSVVLTVSGVKGTTSWNGNTITFHPSAPLENGKTYTAQGKGEDEAGNSVPLSWTFTTADKVKKSEPPTILDYSPTGENVSIDSTVSVTFSKEMDHDSVSLTVEGADGSTQWNDNTLTFIPSEPLGNSTLYGVAVSGSDTDGNSLEFNWSFITAGTTESNTTITVGEGAITGVVKGFDGRPIEGAVVAVNDSVSATTNANGTFQLVNLTTGTYNLTVSKEGYETHTESVSVPDGRSIAVTMSIRALDSAPKSSDGGALLAIMAVVVMGVVGTSMVYKMRKH